MNLLILGGDGYIGWPAAMYFSKMGHEVTVVDNYFRRKACIELNAQPLYQLPSLVERSKIWHKKSGCLIKVVIGDLTEAEFIRSLFSDDLKCTWPESEHTTGKPQAVIHLAEQPSAPYSLINYRYANHTIMNNLLVTNNLMWAVKDLSPETHIIKIGTMGEYGTPNIDIEEGWLEITHNGRKDRFIFPRQASSIYHTSKIMDTDLLWYGVRTWDLKVTDLMQGPVYGIETEESKLDDRMGTIFNYDEIFGTVLNRFIVQAVVGYPLTVYGSGGQTRGYLNLNDTLQCINLSLLNPAKSGEMNIFNQIVETYNVNQLAEMVKSTGEQMGYRVEIRKLQNPRNEADNHYYNPKYQGLINLGLTPNLLTCDVLAGIFKVVERYKDYVNKDIIFRGIKW